MDAFVAAPKTYIVERIHVEGTPSTIKIPVIGWVYVQGTLAYPVAPLSFGGLTEKRAVLLPDGMVCDRFFDETFATLGEWEHACDIHGPAIDRSAGAEVVQEAKPTPPDFVPPNATQPTRPPKKERKLQQKSFWGLKDQRVILTVEGGTILPDERDWTKITRDEYDTRKRDGYVVWKTEDGPGETPRATAPVTTAPAPNDIDDLI